MTIQPSRPDCYGCGCASLDHMDISSELTMARFCFLLYTIWAMKKNRCSYVCMATGSTVLLHVPSLTQGTVAFLLSHRSETQNLLSHRSQTQILIKFQILGMPTLNEYQCDLFEKMLGRSSQLGSVTLQSIRHSKTPYITFTSRIRNRLSV